jgi:hypothetical protein
MPPRSILRSIETADRYCLQVLSLKSHLTTLDRFNTLYGRSIRAITYWYLPKIYYRMLCSYPLKTQHLTLNTSLEPFPNRKVEAAIALVVKTIVDSDRA